MKEPMLQLLTHNINTDAWPRFLWKKVTMVFRVFWFSFKFFV